MDVKSKRKGPGQAEASRKTMIPGKRTIKKQEKLVGRGTGAPADIAWLPWDRPEWLQVPLPEEPPRLL